MAGRSSPNVESNSFSSQSFGAEQLRAFDRVMSLWRGGPAKHSHGDRLRRSSLASARADYTDLVQRIRRGRSSSDPSVPRILLVWFSACPIKGCTDLWQYPQYYLQDHTRPSLHALADLQGALGAEVVDASYGHLPPSPPLPINQCASCETRATTLCNSPEARADAARAGRLCGSRCGTVRDPYYPDDAGHELAARAIAAVLQAPRGAGTAAVQAVRAQGSRAQDTFSPRLRPIALHEKIFHTHLHKASGTAFIAYVAGMDGVLDCAEHEPWIVRSDHTQPSTWRQLQHWWLQPRPRCNFVSIEEPALGDVYSRIRRHAGIKGGTAAAPQMISFYRHPFARCRSHWKYEQSLCHRRHLGWHTQYCTGYFLPRFGAVNASSTHAAFADNYCTEHASRSLTEANGISNAEEFLANELSFFGITERFLESLCLFLYQAGRFRRDLCTCDGARPLLIGRELQKADPREAALQREGSRGLPSLRLSDQELRQKSPRDLALYTFLLGILRQRVRIVELAVNASIWGCTGQ